MRTILLNIIALYFLTMLCFSIIAVKTWSMAVNQSKVSVLSSNQMNLDR